MSRILDQLGDDREAILLLYIAGELSESERLMVEARLQQDARLRATLEEIRAASDRFEQQMQAADEAQPPAVSDLVAQRQVAGLMRQWQADKFRAETQQDAPGAGGRRWWVYPSAAAAVVLLGMLVWWGSTPPGDIPIAADTTTMPVYSVKEQDRLVAMHLRQSFGSLSADENSARLDQAEAELVAMNETPLELFSSEVER